MFKNSQQMNINFTASVTLAKIIFIMSRSLPPKIRKKHSSTLSRIKENISMHAA